MRCAFHVVDVWPHATQHWGAAALATPTASCVPAGNRLAATTAGWKSDGARAEARHALAGVRMSEIDVIYCTIRGWIEWLVNGHCIQRAAPKGLSVCPLHSSLEKESHREVYRRSLIPRFEPSNARWTLTNDYVVDESFGVIRFLS